ncbi:hypothetical protein D3C76_36630 [compost metagenome]
MGKGPSIMRKLFTWIFGSKPPAPLEGGTIYETLINQLGDIHDLTKKQFIAPRTRRVTLETATVNIEELADFLVEAAAFVSKGETFPQRWQDRALQYESRSLEQYIADAGELIHPLDWIQAHQHYIVKLLDAFMKMDEADRDYYQRKCNFVVEDILELIKVSRECVR